VPRHAREFTSQQGQQEDKRKEDAKDLKKVGIGLLFLPPSKTRQEVYGERGLGTVSLHSSEWIQPNRAL
jgi:hypothetical protein